MEAPTSTGKVKVEYTDLFGVYQLVASDLESRLPLKNLNWNSFTRPTRSIDSLYVDLVPDESSASFSSLKKSTSNGLDTPISPSASGDLASFEFPSSKRERRHQIPGLRRTPYLKIYFLRCDDSDTYKATARKGVRDWIKANSPSTQTGSVTSSQDRHDAFEYMIIHVVLPDVQTGAAWPTRASSSVLEKLKSDFNNSSRNAPDRIVQIPATKSLQVQGVTVNPVPTGAGKDAFLYDSAASWDDLIAKMKLLILNSFDSRVKQYEDDIKEKGNQRSHVGWNFCTFFVLKEGLARGFESVGLVEDALMGYDELAVELMSAVRDEANKESRLFREHTQELLIQAETALQGQEPQKNRPNNRTLSTSVLAVDNKPYRELILANNISVFDFKSYVFARQIQIMLRLASLSGKALKANSSAVDLSSSRDPVILAEICWRAKEFFADIARVIRLDLKACFRAEANAGERELKARYTVTENLIASWTYKGAIDILNKTREANLPDVDATDPEESPLTPSGSSHVDTTTPARPSSPLSGSGSQSLDTITSPTRSQALSPHSLPDKARLSLDSLTLQSTDTPSLASGTAALAAERAELYLIARRALSSVGERRGWKTTWPTADDSDNVGELDEISRDNFTTTESSEDGIVTLPVSESATAGVLDTSVRAALVDKETFYKNWEELSLLAFLLFNVAKIRNSVSLITADIAAIRVRLGDYAYAAPFLRQLASQYAAGQWRNLGVAVLDMYVFCLKKLDKPDDYVPAALKMLSKAAKMKGATLSRSSALLSNTTSTPFSNASLSGIIEASSALAKPMQVLLEDYFSDVKLEDFIEHSSKSDEYGIRIYFNSLLSGSLTVEHVSVKVTGITPGAAKEIILSSIEAFECVQGPNIAVVSSKVMYPDTYALDSVTLTAGKVRFVRSYRAVSFQDRHLQAETRSPKLLIWPSARACIVEASVHDIIQLEHPRALVFHISSNGNNVSHAKLVVKSGTAGLRLHTSDAEIIAGECSITADKQPSTVPLSAIPSNTVVKVKIPYRAEGDSSKVNVRSELTYQVDNKTYTYCNNHSLGTQLALGVNVQDIFKKKALFSKFSISTSSETPIRLVDCQLSETDVYHVTSPHFDKQSLVVFPKQPVSLVYRITKNEAQVQSPKLKKLSLKIDYQCLDEQVLLTINHQLVQSLQQSQFSDYTPLLRSHLVSIIKEDHAQQQDLERVALLEQVLIPSYDEMRWETILQMLPTEIQTDVSLWLQRWHEENIFIGTREKIQVANRHLEIPVEIPSLPILHTALLAIEKRPSSRPYTVGELVTAELTISHTRYWSSADKKLEGSLSFIYELETSADTWLIAGRRRGYFTAGEGEVQTFPILLLPLRAGKLMLPVVEIRVAKENDMDERTTCETDYQSLGTAVEVVPGVTGVILDVVTTSSGGLDGEVRILEVERQEDISV